MSETSRVLRHWSMWYPTTPPIGFLLREAYPERWLRIHSLPGSTRYPSSASDSEELLRRHNTVAGDLLGEGNACALFLYEAPEVSLGDVAVRAGLEGQGLDDLGLLPPWLWDDEQGVFGGPMALRGTTASWGEGAFDAFILAVADDVVQGLVINLATGEVYAPYDGGADLLFASEARREAARRVYQNWLSERLDGL